MVHTFFCTKCEKEKTHESDISTGYGTDKDGNKICFDCCGIDDANNLTNLKKGDKYILYWDGQNIINWPSSLKIKPYSVKKGKHNMARTRDDIYFKFNGFNFHAVQYGSNSQIAHIKKILN